MKEFITNIISNFLNSNGWVRTGDVWEHITNAYKPSQTVIINGHRAQTPPTPITITRRVEYFGEGEVLDKNDKCERKFSEVQFYIESKEGDNKEIHANFVECVYPDDTKQLEQYLTQLQSE